MGKFSRPLSAELFQDLRTSERHKLRLAASALTDAVASKVLIHDLSETGLDFETSTDLQIGDLVHVDLLFLGALEAKIVWRENTFYGCEFVAPIPQNTLRASMLQSLRGFVDEAPDGVVEEIPIGIKPRLDAIAEWHVEFEQTKVAKGYRLIGFRQTPKGTTMAMVTKTS